MRNPVINIKRLDVSSDLPIPEYATPGSSGIDLMAEIQEEVIIKPLERALIKTGIAIALPEDYEAQIRPRSGLALKNGITVLNTPGTIDSDYRGEICVILVNLSNESFTVKRGMRIAQMVLSRIDRARLLEVTELPATVRGAGGFGSTGVEVKEKAEA